MNDTNGEGAQAAAAPSPESSPMKEFGFTVYAVKAGKLLKVGGVLSTLSFESMKDTILVAVLRDPRITEASIFDPVSKRMLWGCSPGAFRIGLEKGGLTQDILDMGRGGRR